MSIGGIFGPSASFEHGKFKGRRDPRKRKYYYGFWIGLAGFYGSMIALVLI